MDRISFIVWLVKIDFDLLCYDLHTYQSPRLDWFAVDLEGEHLDMDGNILEELVEYVVYAIHRVCLLNLFWHSIYLVHPS